MLVETYDIGGTWARAALIHKGKILSQVKEHTEKDVCAQIRRLSRTFFKESLSVSIALPGPVRNGILLSAPSLEIKEPLDIRRELEPAHRGKNIYVENDMNVAVLAELYAGQGKEWKSFYLLTLSTGIGAGIIMDGRPISGGEFGHCRVDPHGETKTCSCGRMNCWNAFASGKAIKRTIQEEYNPNTTIEAFFEERNHKSRTLLERIKDSNAQGLGTMINALDTQGIVIMGSLGLNQFEKIIPGKERIENYTINPVPPIQKTTLGEDIGLLGAYYYAKRHTK